MTNLLLISYSCGVQKIRTANVLSANHGFDITILTEHIPDSFKGELASDIDVYYVEDQFSISLYRPYWTYKAIRKLETIFEETNIEVMLSWHVPIASHIVALRAKQKYNIPWIAHFGDPWIGNPYADGLLQKVIYSKKLEKRIVSSANASTFPTDRMKEMYEQRYPEQRSKFSLVPNFIDTSEIEEISNNSDLFDHDKLTIVHMGSFYGIRSPEPLFDAVELLDERTQEQVEIYLVGDLGGYASEIAERNLSEIIQAPGRVPKDEALRMSKSSDVLLLIDAPVQNSPFLPTKLAEYVFMENPILGITPEEGTSADVIRQTETGTVVSVNNAKKISKSIEKYISEFQDDTLSIDPDREEVNNYSSDRAVSKYASVISKITKSDRQ